MPAPILATKLYIPPHRANIVLRSALTERLNEGLRRKLILVSAPAGFGKTTLLSEWIAAYQGTVAWLSLDDGDNDLARFWSHFIAALQTFSPNIGTAALGALQSPQSPSIEAILTSLLNEIISIPDDFILVLDDYHVVDSKQIDNALAFLIEGLPPKMHLVLATREDPDLPLARLRARDQVIELRVKDLRFTTSEAADFLNQTKGLHLSPEDIMALEARTEGWIVGLQLAALSMQGLEDKTSFIRSFTGSHHFVLDYLLEEVLHRQPENIQTFLLQTSILERMCGPLCDAVLLNSSVPGQETLEYLEHVNLLILPLDDRREWYRYHHLFADVLQARLMREQPDQVAAFHLRASVWYEQNEELAEAFHHAIVASDFDRAARLAETAWQGMHESFQTAAWLGWVKQLPASVRSVRPVLCVQTGWAHMDMGNAEASETSLSDAEKCLNHPREDMVIVEAEQFHTLPARIAIARAYNAQVQNRYLDTVKFAEMALELVPTEDQFLHAQASVMLNGAYWASGELDKADAVTSGFVAAAQQAGNFIFAVAASFGKADILIAQGQLRDALRVYQAALELASKHGAENFTAHHHLGLGLLYHEMGEDESAVRHLQKSFELGRYSTIVDWTYRKNLAQAQLKESEGDLTGALAFLEEAQRFYIRTPIPDLRPVDAMKARLHLKQGYLSKAHEWAHKSGLSLRDTPDHLHEFERLMLARVALAEYQDNRNERLVLDVLGYLEPALKLAEAQHRLRSQIDILITQALAFDVMGDVLNALESLEHALTRAEPEGYLRVFLNEGKPITNLSSKLRRKGRIPYTEKILAASNQPKTTQASAISTPALIEPLSERELEVLRLLRTELNGPDIARELMVSLNTMRTHTKNIFSKLGVTNRRAAVRRAEELGLL